jgi:hypothetical protein
MPITYPRDLRLLETVLGYSPEPRLRRRVSTASLPAGLQVMETGTPVWTGQWRTIPLTQSQRRPIEAWLDSLSGARSFLAYWPTKCWPAAHPGGTIVSGAWANSLTVTAVTATTISATAPNAELRLRAGDMVGLEQSSKFGLYRVLEDAQPAGGVIVLEITPRPAVGLFGSGAVLRLNRPVCEMILDPSAPVDVADGFLSSISFSAVQKVT